MLGKTTLAKVLALTMVVIMAIPATTVRAESLDDATAAMEKSQEDEQQATTIEVVESSTGASVNAASLAVGETFSWPTLTYTYNGSTMKLHDGGNYLSNSYVTNKELVGYHVVLDICWDKSTNAGYMQFLNGTVYFIQPEYQKGSVTIIDAGFGQITKLNKDSNGFATTYVDGTNTTKNLLTDSEIRKKLNMDGGSSGGGSGNGGNSGGGTTTPVTNKTTSPNGKMTYSYQNGQILITEVKNGVTYTTLLPTSGVDNQGWSTDDSMISKSGSKLQAWNTSMSTEKTSAPLYTISNNVTGLVFNDKGYVTHYMENGTKIAIPSASDLAKAYKNSISYKVVHNNNTVILKTRNNKKVYSFTITTNSKGKKIIKLSNGKTYRITGNKATYTSTRKVAYQFGKKVYTINISDGKRKQAKGKFKKLNYDASWGYADSATTTGGKKVSIK